MALPDIVTANPVVVPPITVPERVYDRLWLATCVIQATAVGGEANAAVELVPYRILEDGSSEVAPAPSIQFTIENLFALAATRAAIGDTGLATVMTLLLQEVVKLGRERGIVAPDAP